MRVFTCSHRSHCDRVCGAAPICCSCICYKPRNKALLRGLQHMPDSISVPAAPGSPLLPVQQDLTSDGGAPPPHARTPVPEVHSYLFS